jgi:hypothetical protein
MAMVLPLSVTEEGDDEFERRLESAPPFVARIERARKAFQEGKGIRSKDIKWDDEEKKGKSSS